jgi:hypothetical protein
LKDKISSDQSALNTNTKTKTKTKTKTTKNKKCNAAQRNYYINAF